MKLGILSETHGSVVRTRAAINLLMSNSVETVIHCGDIGSEGVLVELLAKLRPNSIPFYAVLGNVDFPDELGSLSDPGVFEILGRFGDLSIAGKRLAIIHGDHISQLKKMTISGEYDYVFTGHTHLMEDRRLGNTRIINPGAVYRATQPSVATLDLGTDHLEFLMLL